MENAREWAELHGEENMTQAQAEKEEGVERLARVERDKQTFSLILTAAELDWLLFDMLESVEYPHPGGEAPNVRATRDKWWEQVAAQGYLPW